MFFCWFTLLRVLGSQWFFFPLARHFRELFFRRWWKGSKFTLDSPPKINIEPEHGELEDDFPSPGVYSQVPC